MTLTENAIKVLEKRYLAKDENGKILESPEDMFRRVAKAIAQADAGRVSPSKLKEIEDEFFEMMYNLEFLPNSPTLMNAGRPLGQLSACFVLPVEDTMKGIFESIKNAALIHKSGGGTGFSFSKLRPKGSSVKSTGGVASGPVSFMKVFNAATEAVKQGGTRRGANMGILRVDHPDIREFITCKQDNKDITNFNISVGITEEFMKAVMNDEEYDLIDPRKKEPVEKERAREIFNVIVDNAWNNGEPGIIFLDRLNKDNVTPELGEIESTNPCGEQPLLPFEACNLGSINLTLMLKKNQAENGEPVYEVDYDKLRDTVRKAVHFLDNVIDVNKYPLQEIERMARGTRKIGLGIMGWADMLCMMNIPYNSERAIELAGEVMKFIQDESKRASAKLAEEKGIFPFYDKSIYKDKGIELRNATTTTIAPTGTLSIIAGVSSGIEPIFAICYIRNVMDNDELVEVNPVFKEVAIRNNFYSEELMKQIAKKGSIKDFEEIPAHIRKVFVTSHDIDPEWHVRMQAAFQEYTDNAVSKTVNLRHDATREDVRKVYELAYETGCKGVTIYRDGSRDSQVLNIGSVKGKEAREERKGSEARECIESVAERKEMRGDMLAAEARTKMERKERHETGKMADSGASTDAQGKPGISHVVPRPRPDITTGFTEKVRIGCGNLYITVNYDEHGICEVFTNLGRGGGCPSQSEATSRLVSIALRAGLDVKSLVEQLKGIRCATTIRQKDLKVMSCPDAIGRVIEKVMHLQNNGGNNMEELQILSKYKGSDPEKELKLVYCPECGQKMEHEGGCVVCRNCGFSKCG
ncbi:MAG: vitamin B12-dependent ribonucleotide reductase [Clostridiaceae bacterium]|nr:vitamin B12-dependent ribonucleotide reductase [Clostridiaceae bacterium]